MHIDISPSPVPLATFRDLARLRTLADTFPSLNARFRVEGAPLLLKCCRDIAESTSGSGARFAARFILSVYDSDPATAVRLDLAFDLRRAWQTWDDTHRAAYLAWSAAPWWC